MDQLIDDPILVTDKELILYVDKVFGLSYEVQVGVVYGALRHGLLQSQAPSGGASQNLVVVRTFPLLVLLVRDYQSLLVVEEVVLFLVGALGEFTIHKNLLQLPLYLLWKLLYLLHLWYLYYGQQTALFLYQVVVIVLSLSL